MAHFDVVVIGSGFGGSVCALRLVEKGYGVAVLEAGRRFADHEFPKTSWQLRSFLWAPALRCFGIQRVNLLRDVLVLSGSGVGGGSLIYGNTLYEPLPQFFADPQWAHLTDWADELAPHYGQAKRMLGVVTHHRITRNTLTKNYLHLAEQAGAEVFPLTTVTAVEPDGEGYLVTTCRTGGLRKQVFTADQVVFAAGTLGTQRLLHRMKSARMLPYLSDKLGTLTRTNDNSLVVRSKRTWYGRRKLTSRQGHGQPNPTWITAHILGGCVMGESREDGVIDPYHRVYGHPGLHVVDGAAVSANLGANPSLTIAAQAERAMSLWPNKGESDLRSPLGSAYRRVAAVNRLTG